MKKPVFLIGNLYVIIISILNILVKILKIKYPCILNEGLGIEGCYNINDYYGNLRLMVEFLYNYGYIFKLLFVIAIPIILVISIYVSVKKINSKISLIALILFIISFIFVYIF